MFLLKNGGQKDSKNLSWSALPFEFSLAYFLAPMVNCFPFPLFCSIHLQNTPKQASSTNYKTKEASRTRKYEVSGAEQKKVVRWLDELFLAGTRKPYTGKQNTGKDIL